MISLAGERRRPRGLVAPGMPAGLAGFFISQ